ncbi:MAG TPA: FHA domain-containing protein [Anaerolineales bacterium]|nr:FHA domain-containing protein [Anaerolineales bacterium]
MSGLLVLALRLLMAVAIYTFLGGALWIIWQDLRQQGQNAALRRLPPIHIEVRARNRVLVSRTFSKPEIILGRNPECDIPINDETTSARHARLSYHHNQWWVEDLNSTNGTKLNREKLTLPTVLTTDDEIQCGKARAIITLGKKHTDPTTQKL